MSRGPYLFGPVQILYKGCLWLVFLLFLYFKEISIFNVKQ